MLPPAFVAIALAFGLEPSLLNELICEEFAAENPKRLILRDIDPEITAVLSSKGNVQITPEGVIVSRRREPFVLPPPN